MRGNFYGWVNITANCFYFNLNVLKFELASEWTPPQIFFWGYRVLQLLCLNVERGMTSSVVKNSWNQNFANFRDFVQRYYQRYHRTCPIKRSCSWKFCNIQRKTHVPESFFKLHFYLKRDSGIGVFLWI